MKKEEFREKAHSVLDEVINHIIEMEKKSNDVSDDLKDEYNKKLSRLKEIKLDLTAKLNEYEKMSESKWDIVKDSFSDFLDKVNKAWKDSYNKASSAFK
jgi:hypothetical protein